MEKKEEVAIEAKSHVQGHQQFGFLKPLGKLVGNNIFTFHRPNLDELFNTLNSFPEPKYLLTSENHLFHPLMRSLHQVRTYIIGKERTNKISKHTWIAWDNLASFLHEIGSQNAMIVIALNTEDKQVHLEELNTIIEQLKA